jgi:hypothetical protein
MKTLVLVMEGKNESVDVVRPMLFDTLALAKEFVSVHNASYNPVKKYWSYAEVAALNEKFDLTRPEE